MESRVPPLSSESVEARAAWYAACVSVTFALVALLPSLPLRALAVAAGVTLAITLAHAYQRRATPFLAAIVTCGAVICSVATAAWLEELTWAASMSSMGRVGGPEAWLFNTAMLCFGIGVLATGRLILREGYQRGDLLRREYLLASVLPVVASVGLLTLALCPVGGARMVFRAHIMASWAVLGSFWCGMVASACLPSLTRALRYYSSVAAVLVFAVSLPVGLRLIHLTEATPIPMLVMELGAYPPCLVWFCWLAREWSPTPVR